MTDTSPGGFADIARAAYEAMPQEFRTLTKDILIRIDDFPSAEVMGHFELHDRYGLLGLYHGVDILQKTGFDTLPHQDMVFLYREPILRFWREGPDSLERIIQHVLIHEIGHHFGFSDDDMHGLEDEARAEDRD